jgi:hypothetical protein
MKKLTLVALITMMTLALLPVGTSTTVAQDDDACFNRGGQINEETGECEIRSGVEIIVNYPVELAQEAPFIAETMDEFVDSTRRAFADNWIAYGLEDPFGLAWYLQIDYQIFRYDENLVSVNFGLSDYTGGAHGNLVYESFVFDKQTEQVLSLDDVFAEGALEEIAPVVQDRLIEDMGEMADASWIEDGTAPEPANYRNFVLGAEGVTFFFPPYQVAAYAAGPQSVTLSYDEILNLLAVELSAQ